jgi:hypothetical protein
LGRPRPDPRTTRRQRIGKGLHVSERHLVQRLAGKAQEALHVGAVGTLGMHTAPVQPQVNQLRVSIRLTDYLNRLSPIHLINYDKACFF